MFESMYDGTLASEGPWQALVTFQQLIVLADQDGVVDMTANAISRRTSIPLEIIKAGLEVLARPDPDSRTPDEDGRRIVCLEDHRDWGWQIVNHRKYQQMRNAAERREYLRVAQAERRARLKEEAVNTCQQSQQLSAPVSTSTPKDAYKDEDVNKEKREDTLKPPKGGKGSAISFKAWAEKTKASGEKLLPPSHPVFEYAQSTGIPEDYLRLAWLEFRHRYGQPDAKRYKDWRGVFEKAVRGNWFKLWWLSDNGYALTTAGQQAQRAHEEGVAA